VYGPLRLLRAPLRPYVFGNFATTLDGVVSLQVPGRSGGGEITGFDLHDRLLMGILRAAADAVIVGAGTLRAVPRHIWTAQHIYPPRAAEYAELRRQLRKAKFPLNVIVTSEGRLDLHLPLFSANEVPVLIVTTSRGARRLSKAPVPPGVHVAAASRAGPLTATAILAAVEAHGPQNHILVEGGPHLIGDFFAERRLDELFLTVAPQIAGRDDSSVRPGLVAGRAFAPDHPLWVSLVGVRRGRGHLFLRFAMPSQMRPVARVLRVGHRSGVCTRASPIGGLE
jgi:riboflavin biosynthesis pyrimidine reductase